MLLYDVDLDLKSFVCLNLQCGTSSFVSPMDPYPGYHHGQATKNVVVVVFVLLLLVLTVEHSDR